jgi:DNA invertase Pin-like site-specific DNA recombinase
MRKEIKKAVAYLRTSSAANVGADKDSDKRQLAAIEAFSKTMGFQVVAVFYDAAVSGADPVTERPGFMDMLSRVVSNGAKTILVESPDRFARDLAVQLAGHDMLKSMGIALIPATAPDFFTEDTPTAVLVRQVLGAIAQFEKASTVAKLATARKRKREKIGKCEGRKGHAELRPDVVRLVKELRHVGVGRKPKSGVLSLRAISAELAARGHMNESGKPFNAKSISAMLLNR